MAKRLGGLRSKWLDGGPNGLTVIGYELAFDEVEWTRDYLHLVDCHIYGPGAVRLLHRALVQFSEIHVTPGREPIETSPYFIADRCQFGDVAVLSEDPNSFRWCIFRGGTEGRQFETNLVFP